MKNEKLYQVALTCLPGIGDYLVKALISHFGSAEQVFRVPKGKISRVQGIGPKIIEKLDRDAALEKAEKTISYAEKEGVQVYFYTEEDYPYRLKHIPDSPPILFYKGNADLNPPKSIGIVGTRDATDYGRACVGKIINYLKQWNCLVVSGLAYGIDIHAHKEALKNDLPTLGVMGSGIDIIYPALHRSVAKEMIQQGGLLTEHALEVEPDAHHFPARNRIIAGMSDLLIVVEAAEKGGALITANLANQYNREVVAVPGSWEQKMSKGCNQLIRKNQAHLLTDPAQIAELLNWDIEKPKNSLQQGNWQKELAALENEEQKVIQLLQQYDNQGTIDELSWKSQIPINQIANILLQLEFKGWVSSLPGKKFKLIKL